MKSSPPLALVTGATQRLGFAFAQILAKQGYAILLHYHSSLDDAEAAVQKLRFLDVPVFLAQADLTDSRAISNLFNAVDATALPLRVLVNSAATMQRVDSLSLSVEDWDATMNLNLRAPFLLAQQAQKRMSEIGGGLIVNISDVGAEKAWPNFPAYTISKAGLQSLTKVLARSFAPNTRVNAIAPGLVLPSADISTKRWVWLIERLPFKRPAKLNEIASALEFLLENKYVTGQTITVDGGYSLL